MSEGRLIPRNYQFLFSFAQSSLIRSLLKSLIFNLKTEYNKLERSLNYLQPVQTPNHQFKFSWILNFETVIQDLNHLQVV